MLRSASLCRNERKELQQVLGHAHHLLKKLRSAFVITAAFMCVIGLAASAQAATPVKLANGTASPATAAARFAAAATPRQNKVLNDVMTRVAGGTRVSASEVEWDAGRVVFGVSATADESPETPYCKIYFDTGSSAPAGTCGYNAPNSYNDLQCQIDYFCAWDAPGENAAAVCWMYVSGDAGGLWFDWGLYSGEDCGSTGTWSWNNETPFRVWRESSHSGGDGLGTYMWDGGSGTAVWCISPNVNNSDVTDSASRTAGWIQMTSNSAKCS
jgi:hypothetical protein